MKNYVFWDVTPCDSCKNRYVLQLLVTGNIITISLIIFILNTEVICFSETSDLSRAIRHHIPEDNKLYSNVLFERCSVHTSGGTPALLTRFSWFSKSLQTNSRVELCCYFTTLTVANRRVSEGEISEEL
jgi:hypothetical protein